jgi:hypothetical protein
MKKERLSVLTEIERRGRELVRDRDSYDKAKAQIKEFDSSVIMELYEIVARYTPGDDANKAIWTLAQVTQILNKVSTPFRTVADYERKRNVIKKASGELQEAK